MSHSVLVKVAPLVCPDVWDKVKDGEEPASRFYDRGALKLLRREGVPLVVDHNMERQIGIVRQLYEFTDTDGWWWAWAKATVPDPPEWLRRGTPASFGRYDVHVSSSGWTHRAFVREVSVLREEEPAEPRARVELLKREDVSAARASAPAAGEVFYGGPVLRRPGIGRVLEVR